MYKFTVGYIYASGRKTYNGFNTYKQASEQAIAAKERSEVPEADGGLLMEYNIVNTMSKQRVRHWKRRSHFHPPSGNHQN